MDEMKDEDLESVVQSQVNIEIPIYIVFAGASSRPILFALGELSFIHSF